MVTRIASLFSGGAYRDWAPRAFREFAARRPLYAISRPGRPWIEIDFPEDYQRAVTEVYPMITGLSAEPNSAPRDENYTSPRAFEAQENLNRHARETCVPSPGAARSDPSVTGRIRGRLR